MSTETRRAFGAIRDYFVGKNEAARIVAPRHRCGSGQMARGLS